MKNIKKIALFVVVLLMVTGCGKEACVNEKGAKVASLTKGGITVESLYSKLKDKYGAQEFIDLLDSEIFKKDKETDAEKEKVRSQIEELQKSAKESNISYSELLSYYGFDNEDALKDYIVLSSRREAAVNNYLAKNLKSSEIDKYYEDQISGDISLKHILIKVDVKDDAKDEEKTKADTKAKKQAEDIIKKLNNKEKFEELAKKYSDDTATAKNGGDLGWVSKGDMVTEFENAAFALKKGEYTKNPVKTTYGYHIIYKLDEKNKPKLKEVEDEIKTNLVKDKLEKDKTLYYDTLDKIRKDAGLKFEDDSLKKEYEKYLSNLKKQATSSTAAS